MVHVSAYISTIISAAANEGPDEMMCFPAGLHYLLTFQAITSKISQKSICLYANFSKKECLYIAIYANFSEKGCLYIAIYANFFKREKERIGRPAGKHISPRPSSPTEIIGNCLPVSQTSHFSQKSSE